MTSTRDRPHTTIPAFIQERRFFGDTEYWTIEGVTRDCSETFRPLEGGERFIGAFVTPPFQRQSIWTSGQKVRLIESICLRLPIGAILFNHTSPNIRCNRWLLDGYERLTALVEFKHGNFSVYGWRYPDLPESERRRFDQLDIAVTETNITDPDECQDVYDRLVYGSIHSSNANNASEPPRANV